MCVAICCRLLLPAWWRAVRLQLTELTWALNVWQQQKHHILVMKRGQQQQQQQQLPLGPAGWTSLNIFLCSCSQMLVGQMQLKQQRTCLLKRERLLRMRRPRIR
jgi:hypothetical protein